MSSEIFNSTTAHEGVAEKAIHTEVAEKPVAVSEWEKPDTAAEWANIHESKGSDEVSESTKSEAKAEQVVEASAPEAGAEKQSDSVESGKLLEPTDALPDSQHGDAAGETLPESIESNVSNEAKLTVELWRGEGHWFDGGEDAETAEGFGSPLDAFDFAENVALGDEIKEKLDAANTADGDAATDLVDTHLNASESSSEHPLGESYTQWFKEEYGENPYTETRQEREDQLGK